MARILVVEDNEDLLEVLAHLLRHEHEVHTAASGEEAVQLAPGVQPDVVLLDLQLPAMDGIETGRALKRLLGDDVPILVLTALAEQSDRDEVLASGCCDAYLAKPATFAAILEQVSRLLERRREVA